jgi:hypothetical protein
MFVCDINSTWAYSVSLVSDFIAGLLSLGSAMEGVYFQ